MNIHSVDFSKWVEIKVTRPFNNPRVMQPKHSQKRCMLFNAYMVCSSFTEIVCIASLQVIEQLPSDLEVPLGSELHLSVQVAGPGSERLLYKWFKNGIHLFNTREPVLQIKQVVLEDHGLYICSACNETDSVLSTECLVTGKSYPKIGMPNLLSIVVTGRYYHEPNEINSLVSTEHNGTNMIYGRIRIYNHLTCEI